VVFEDDDWGGCKSESLEGLVDVEGEGVEAERASFGGFAVVLMIGLIGL
jgi:hypothetical protein